MTVAADRELSEASGSSRDEFVSESSGPLGKALAHHSPELWHRLCEKGGGRLPALSYAKDGDKQPGLAETYRTRSRIGQGSTSVIYDGMRRADGRKVAMKAMRGKMPEDALLAEQEYELLRRLQHPCIVSALEMQSVGGHAVIVLERVAGHELGAIVQGTPTRSLGEAVSCTLMAALVRAVKYLHESDVVHCDIRPQNVLVSLDLKSLKLTDFGSCLQLNTSGTYLLPQVGDQVRCSAPEVVLGEQPAPRSDVWQLGLCMHFMLSGLLPQRRDECEASREALRAVATKHVSMGMSPWRDLSRQAKGMLRHCLTIDKLERPTSTCLVRKAAWLRPALHGASAETSRTTSGLSSALLGGLEPLDGDGFDDGEFDKEKPDACLRSNALQSQETMDPPSTCSAGTASTRGTPHSSLSPATDSPPVANLVALSEVVCLGAEKEKATVLLIDHADRTYKVRLPDGSIKVVPAEDARLP